MSASAVLQLSMYTCPNTQARDGLLFVIVEIKSSLAIYKLVTEQVSGKVDCRY